MRALVLLGLAPLALAGCGGSSRASYASIPVKTVALPTHTVTYVNPSSSMMPTIQCAPPSVGCDAAADDRLVTQEPAYNLKRGDVIVFNTPALAAIRCGAGGKFVKRIVGMPGERFEERDGFVYIDGKRLSEPYVPASERDTQTTKPITVPAHSYFVLGDNRSSSCDSRDWGSVPAANVLGKVVQIIRPK